MYKRQLIDIYGVNAIINAGAAGGMDTRLDIFDTVVCTNTAYHDVDDEILTEYHPFMQSSFFSSDDLLLTISKEMIQKAESGHRVYLSLIHIYGRACIHGCSDTPRWTMCSG